MFFLVSLFFATTTCIDFWVWRQLDNDVKNAVLWAAMTNEFYRCDWYNVFHLSHECSILPMLVFLMFVTDSWFSHSYAVNLDMGLGVVGEAIRTFDLPKYLGHVYRSFHFTSRIKVSSLFLLKFICLDIMLYNQVQNTTKQKKFYRCVLCLVLWLYFRLHVVCRSLRFHTPTLVVSIGLV